MIELKITAESAGELAEQLKGLADTMAGKLSKKQEVSKVTPTAFNAAPKEEPKVDPPTEENPITKTVENSDAEAHPILTELAKSKSLAQAYEILRGKQIEVAKMLMNASIAEQEKIKKEYRCAKDVKTGVSFSMDFSRSWFPTIGVTILKELKDVENTPENVEKYVKAYDEYVKLITFISKA